MSEGIATFPEEQSATRIDLYSLEHLCEYARELAGRLQVVERPAATTDLFSRLNSSAARITRTHQELTAAAARGEVISGSAEWLLDNYYVIEEQLQEIDEDLPPSYFAELPKLVTGEPRVYLLVNELLLHTDGLLDEATIAAYVQAFQERAALSIGETWAVPIMLRIGLVEYLGRLAAEMSRSREQHANVCAILDEWPGGLAPPKPLDTTSDPELLIPVLIAIEDCSADDLERLAPLERLLQERNPTLHERVREYHQRQAADQISVGNIITAMRLLSALDWIAFFERCSLVEQILRGDPTHAYGRMDYESRDRYRHALEKVARRADGTEIEVAEAAVRLAAQVSGTGPLIERQRHVGYWLVDDGLDVLKAEFQYRPTVRDRVVRLLRRKNLATYLAGILALTVAGTATVLSLSSRLDPWAMWLLALPIALAISEFAVGMVNYLVTRIIRPRALPKLELRDGIPPELRAIVIVPSMLTSRDEIADLLERLELHHVANADPNIAFALLTDFADADAESLPTDAALLEQAVNGIQALNARYGAAGVGPFFLFHRKRVWNAREGRWLGWERKRGKLMEFNQLLLGAHKTTYIAKTGNLDALLGSQGSPVRFVITCDADTQLPHGAARRLIGALSHPLNRPCFDAAGRQVIAGYSLIQPRVSIALADGQRSWYVRIMGNSQGIDPYATAASDVYQDLFGEGSFTGKGIYDVAAFEQCLAGAFGENQILSHDLIEGCHVRTALASDIELIDGSPMRYHADARRQHRWVRGDWQIASWLLPWVPSEDRTRRNRLSWLSRWKIADNLRRSLAPPAICLSMICGWYLDPAAAWVWSLAGLLCLATPVLVALIGSLDGLLHARDWWTGVRTAGANVTTAVLQLLVLAVSLPHRAASMVDAIARTIWRMLISRRRLLEWETAASTERRLSSQAWSAVTRLWYVSALALVLLVTLPWPAIPTAAPWLLAWFGAPLILELISRPLKQRKSAPSSATRIWLKLIARKNWNYFEETLNDENHWLPPDNVQEYPSVRVANRLSPTNEGLFLVSVGAARDFGYLGLGSVAEWWERNLASLSSLPRVGGHFFNWYDTVNLQPLRPRYLSTVDSGNLAACLLVVQENCMELRRSDILSPALWEGLLDTIAVADETLTADGNEGQRATTDKFASSRVVLEKLRTLCENPPERLWDWPPVVRELASCAQQLTRQLAASPSSRTDMFQAEPHVAALGGVVRWLESIRDDYARCFAWVDQFVNAEGLESSTSAITGVARWQIPPACRGEWEELKQALAGVRSLADVMLLEERVAVPLTALRTALAGRGVDSQSESAGRMFLAELSGVIRGASRQAEQLDRRFVKVGRLVEELGREMDFTFLYDPLRRLFSIGYNLEEDRLDSSHYDLLCSEARLSSYLAIAKGDVPVRHWFRLGRQTTYSAGRTGLLSWGGTMFEFLMPLLFQPRIEGSLLSAACKTAVAKQREYGEQRNLPWGVSESAFASLSPNSDYQYQSFGVPGLGLKRGLSRDQVVAPYATMLALEIEPQAAFRNLRRLADDGLLARWGFYEAIDFTPARLPTGRKSAIVRCFMAHHQGMSFLALANLLNEEVIRRRFRANPLMRAAELLLQERVPISSPMLLPHADESSEVRIVRPADQPVVSRRIGTYDTPTPLVHMLSNGSYAVMLTNAGGGSSRWHETAVSRWQPDATRDPWGQWLYLRDHVSGSVWSPTYQPTLAIPDDYEVIFSIDKAEFRRRDGNIESSLEVTISQEDQVEIRQLRLTNLGKTERILDVTSYLEVVLTSAAADLAHPAFQKLFVETEYLPESKALLARRRPRTADDPPLWAVHVLCVGDGRLDGIQWETSRAKFLGRGRSTLAPAAMDPGQSLSGTTGPVLDPILALRCRLKIPVESSVNVAFITGLATTREEALRLADLYHDWRAVHRAFELSWAFSQVELRHWRLTAAQTQRYQRLAASVIYPTAATRGPLASIVNNRLNQSQLWPLGISGDRPIVLLRVTHSRQLIFVREMLTACDYWAYRQLHVDLIILNCLPGSYLDELQEHLERLVRELPRRVESCTGVKLVLRCAQLADAQMQLLEAVAALVLDAGRGWTSPPTLAAAHVAPPLVGEVTRLPTLPKAAQFWHSFSPTSQSSSAARARQPLAPSAPATSLRTSTRQQGLSTLECWNGFGGFADDGREYHIAPDQQQLTPMPWSNVIANDRIGCLVTDLGGGYTWAENSRENKLTTWCNDPISDAPSEQLYLRDEVSSVTWPLFGGPAHTTGDVVVVHGQGWSEWRWSTRGLRATVTISIAVDDPVKFVHVELHNHTSTAHQLSLTFFAELVLGVCREQTQTQVVTEIDSATGALLARSAYHPEYPEQIIFLRALGDAMTVLGDRSEFLGRNRSPWQPAALDAPTLSGKIGPGLDPCGAVQTKVPLGPQQSRTIAFVMGRGEDRAEARELLQRYASVASVAQALEQTKTHWSSLLESVQVTTPNREFDLLVNRWLVYQTLSCRIWGRAAFYQASGAYGFRDQLQDVMALVYARPDVSRGHLLRAAARQFLEGDVQHWWHPPTGRGTRTRFSDDLLWLIVATCHYIEVTRDDGVWNERIPFLESPPLSPDEHERYELPRVSHEEAPLYEHCLRALRQGFRLGGHGLPLMGCGDWNDGMNKVGEQGQGESIWVGWFLLVILKQFLPIMEQRGDGVLAAEYREKCDLLRENLERHGWDGDWYRRAYFDDGTPLGSKDNAECQIDSIAQSWSVLAHADPERSARALESAIDRLVRPQDHLVALFAPPFDTSTPNPGYIMGYLKGVRENGGQYTHAVLWMIQALTESGDGARAMDIFNLINPLRQTATRQDVLRYQVEPYVMAADVYSEPPHVGRGGWTWYTGSASWTYRAALENMLGLRRRGFQVSFRPCVPRNWTHFEVALRIGRATWRFRVELPQEPAAAESGKLQWITDIVDVIDDGQEHALTLVCRPEGVAGTPAIRPMRPEKAASTRAVLHGDR